MWDGGYGGWGSHFGGMGYGFGWIFMVLFWVLIIGGIVAIVRGSFSSGPSHHGGAYPHTPPRRTALDILKERYARGEIDKAEFEEKRDTLGE